jgi:hypothetical protein
MDFIKLANSIQAVVRRHYVPFQGIDADAVTADVQRRLPVSRQDIESAIALLTG